tara:strand:- start:2453 stop:3118 length:666 start_codon:yes stop_codon:yes gene_type:complete
MGELVYKLNLNQDWISFASISNIFLAFLLIKINRIRTFRLFNFLKIDIYLSKHNSERETQYLNPYNIIGTLIISNTACLLLVFYLQKVKNQKIYFFDFCSLLLLIIIFLITRYFIATLLTRRNNVWKKIKPLIFRNFTINLQYAFAYFLIVFIGFNYNIPSFLFFITVNIISVMWVLSQSKVFFSIFKFEAKEVIYFILYLCTFKIFPWYWFYKIVLEPRF